MGRNYSKNHAGDSHSFGGALVILKCGGRVWRENWIHRNMWLELESPEHEAPRIKLHTNHSNER